MCYRALELEIIQGGLALKMKLCICVYVPVLRTCFGVILSVDYFLGVMKIGSHWVSPRHSLSETLVVIPAASVVVYPGGERFRASSLSCNCKLGKCSMVIEVFFFSITIVCAS